MRMRVVEAQDLAAPGSRRPPGAYVIAGIDCEPVGIGVDVRRPHGLRNRVAGADEQSAALGRRRFARVGDDVVVRAATEHHGRNYSASTTIAMPMPPPMHSAATP